MEEIKEEQKIDMCKIASSIVNRLSERPIANRVDGVEDPSIANMARMIVRMWVFRGRRFGIRALLSELDAEI